MKEKSKVYSVRLKPDTYKKLKQIAEKEGITPSAYTRRVIEDNILAMTDLQGFVKKLEKQTQENLKKLNALK